MIEGLWGSMRGLAEYQALQSMKPLFMFIEIVVLLWGCWTMLHIMFNEDK